MSDDKNFSIVKRKLSAKDKRIKKKEAFLKAKKEYDEFLRKRKMEIADMLFKVDDKIGDYDNEILMAAFNDMANNLDSQNYETK